MAAEPAGEEKLLEKPQVEEQDMEFVKEEKSGAKEKADTPAGNGVAKRAREDGGGETNTAPEGDETKKQKVDDNSSEEERIARLEGAEVAAEEEEEEAGEDGGEEEEEKSTAVSVGPKTFSSSVEMFDYFYKLLHTWPPNLDLNKYEQMVLIELLEKGHPDPSKKIGEGIQSFQVRFHPLFKSRCFFLVRADGTTDDFSFRKCVDAIRPLPEDMKAPALKNKAGGRGGGRAFGGRGGRGHGGRGGSRR